MTQEQLKKLRKNLKQLERTLDNIPSDPNKDIELKIQNLYNAMTDITVILSLEYGR